MSQEETDRAAIEELTQAFNERANHYASSLIRLVLAKDTKGTLNLYYGSVQFLDRPPTSTDSFDYGDVILVEHPCPPAEALQFIVDTLHSKRLRLSDIEIDFDAKLSISKRWQYTLGRLPSDDDFFNCGWPTYVAWLDKGQSNQTHGTNRPLINKDAPIYPDLDSLLSHRVGRDMRNSNFLHKLMIVVPDYRARIKVGTTRIEQYDSSG